MRLKLQLRLNNSKQFPINYNYPLSSAIYNLLRLSSPEFAAYLHDIGYQINGKKFKLFTFALQLKNFRIDKDVFILNSPEIEMYISSPLTQEFINNFLTGTFEKQTIQIYYNYIKYNLDIQQVESLPDPQFNSNMKFVPYTSIILSTPNRTEKGIIAKYLRYDAEPEEINRLLTQNLLNKYAVISKQEYTGKNIIKLEWDMNYIDDQLRRGKKLTSKITIDNSHIKIDVIGIRVPFTLCGDAELIKTGYYCGFGEKNSLGFGMVRAVK